jgi:hypothetical protein
MLIGYARVSTNELDTAAQMNALKAAKCERIYGRKLLVDGGTRRNFTGCSISSARAMFSSCENSTDSPVPSSMF